MTIEQSVSVIIPTFNRAERLPRALISVLEQSRPADEVIVVDDGSSDQTRELLEAEFPAIKLIVQSNQGVSAARNRGAASSSGHWLAFLDSDDEWLPEKLEVQMQAAAANPQFSLIHSNEIWIRRGVRVNQMKKHRKSGGDIFSDCLPRCIISPSAVMLRRELFDAVGQFDESLPACEDYDLWLRICHQHEVLYIDKPLLVKYGGHEDQLSTRYWGMDRFRVKALDKLLSQISLEADKEREARAILLEKCRVLMVGAHKRNNVNLLDYCEAMIQKHVG